MPPWLGPVVVALVAVAMAAWTWRAWPDPLIDFGQQLYVSWRLAEGDALYRDVAYLYGPLSPWFNGLLFRVFGTSLTTLVAANLAILGGVIALLWSILRFVGNRTAATIGGIVFVTCFAFAQLVEYGNYNFVCPYVHGVTHGMALSLLAVWGLIVYQRKPRTRTVATIGLVVGLLFLTKAELFLAGSLAVTCGLALTWRQQRLAGRSMARLAAIFAGCALTPPLVAFGLLALRMPLSDALSGVLGTWPDIVAGEAGRLPFYRWSMGVVEPGQSLRIIGKSILWYGALLAPAATLGLFLRRPGRYRGVLAIAVLLATTLFLAWWPVWWPATTGLLPVAMTALGLIVAAGLFRRRATDSDAEASRRIVALTLILFALLLLARILLFARTSHYGFALAMPATMVAIVALFDWLPSRIERGVGYGGLLRAAALAVCYAFVLGHLAETRHYLGLKSVVAGNGPDAFRADERGRDVNEMLAEIERRTKANSTLAVLPAGVMLNYLSRRANPTPFIYYMPGDLLIAGEARMLERFDATPPDHVVLVHKDTSEFGARFFGRDYGRNLGDWIRENYQPLVRVGAMPLQDERPGMLLMRRRGPDEGDRSLGEIAPRR